MNIHSLRIIVDNQAADGLIAEHGLSILIEVGGHALLFDAGQQSALEFNAKQMGIELRHIDALVLSHGHYDHTGDVDYVMQENPQVPVYAHPAVLKTRYSLHPNVPPKEISMRSEERLIVENLPDSQLSWVSGPASPAPGIWMTGPIPRTHPLEDTGGPFFDDADGRIPDAIPDDMALWIETQGGLLVVCGCCHSGLINTLEHICRQSGQQRIRGIIGGLHLKHASEERLQATATALRKYNPDFMVPCHCTGDAAINYFKQNLDIEIQPGYAGYELQQKQRTGRR